MAGNMIGLHNLGLGITPPLGHSPVPDPSNSDEYMRYLADDQQFVTALSAALGGNSFGSVTPEGYQSIINAAQANVGNLTPQERAQIIAEAKTIYTCAGRATLRTENVLASIERMSNNQGYTGPDAGTVVTHTPTAGGGIRPVTRGEILDDENFGNLVNSVFTAAGGTSYTPALGFSGSLGLSGMPGDLFDGVKRSPLSEIDISKWSEAERTEFLNKVAEFGKDGTMLSWEEQSTLHNMAMGYSRNGDNEPTAVTANANGFVKATPISKDDLMENGSFEKQLNSMIPWNAPQDGAEIKALKDAIATANYDELGYEERVALVNAFNAANSDGNSTVAELAEITQMIERFQTSSGSGAASDAGTTLSNGLVVSTNDVARPDNFMSMVNAVLDRSGVTTASTNPFTGTSYYGLNGFSNNPSTLPTLRFLDVSKLTPAQRIEVLEMISQAASDREVTRDEANAISSRVNQLSGRGAQPFFFRA
jgi:hypothetical protein